MVQNEEFSSFSLHKGDVDPTDHGYKFQSSIRKISTLFSEISTFRSQRDF